ncbi:MAG: xanthine dehydrogenase family protein molybdopterin-binding subunit [Actinomycetota bacterium]|nr:carbon monoxide dehydrogenase [Micrococcales bacterium]MEC7590723.1 xanthine dehydrogenase family protein molybdopterin-binding subunit [Actinomycetota bacterium]MAK39173.1 carbon monoxide dehydrogenase [Micrococcales bacterium]MEC8647463.1 xanthine dehydrogenase family protein molybdopterin-binding subunit [Actinomycetota bacterium]MEC9180367.1 xanthine dehydrogenase family protein molybdopterin-binding subunit [Actinomycetota bacterium]
MTETVETSTPLGRPIKRKEDAKLLHGRTNWTDNIQLPGTLHMAILRSPFAHANITKLDVSGALQQPNVVAAYGADELGDLNGSVPCVWPVTDDIVMPDFPSLAKGKVRQVGDCVAVVLATDAKHAADALEAIDVEYEPLDAIVDMEAALAPDSPLLHEDAGTNQCYVYNLGGGYDDAKAKADVVVKRRFINQRLIPAFMEPRSVVAAPMGMSDEITVWSSTQIPHVLRVLIALVTGIPENNLRIVAPDVGGGFGGKLQIYREEILVTQIARKLGRPVKWTESRSEDMVATHHGRDQIQDIEIAATKDGTLLGLKVDLLANMGAYLQIITPGTPLLGMFMYPAIYKMDAYDFQCTGVFTSTTPTDAYRGAGRPEATYAIERIMDELAAALDMDPMALRQKNWITHEEFPYTTVAGLTYDTGNYEAATAKAMDLFGMDELRAEQQRRRESGDPVQLGIGISTFTEMCGLAPSRTLGALKYVAGGWEHATIRMLPTGKVELITGTSPHGQGHETAWSQIAASILGIGVEDIEVVHGDTGRAPYGMDTYGSRSLAVGGQAIKKAADNLIEKATVIAAHQLECSPGDLEFADGQFSVKGDPEKSQPLAAVAFEAFTAHNLPDGVEPTLQGEATVDPEDFSFPHGTHLAAMEVDTETGQVTVRKYVAVDDVGVQVNPMIVEGQVHGGLAQGIAQALYEGAFYDEDGLPLNANLSTYLIPAAPDLPSFITDRTETPSTTHPLGTKGVGEAGTIASTPAIINGVVDALRPLGVTDVAMPATPMTVWKAIQAAKGGQA